MEWKYEVGTYKQAFWMTYMFNDHLLKKQRVILILQSVLFIVLESRKKK